MKVELVIDGTPYEMALTNTDSVYVATATLPKLTLSESELNKEFPVIIRVTYDDETTQDFEGYSIYVTASFITITDRTQADVDTVKSLQQKLLAGTASAEELEQYQKDSKGSINTSDFVRNWRNIHLLAQMLQRISLTPVNDPYEPQRPEIPNSAYYQSLIDAVTKLREHRELHNTTPATPSRPLSTYQKWNDIEKIIFDYYWMLRGTESAVNYCGDEYYCGEGLGVVM